MAIQNPKDLLATLAGSKALKANDAAYQVLVKLINLIGTNQVQLGDEITVVQNGLEGPILTYDNDLADLPNSRKLVAGTNISFDDSLGGERIISATGGSSVQSTGAVFINDFDQDEGIIVPGPQGPAGSSGSSGSQGSPGVSVLAIDGADGIDSFIPGPSGPQGNAGSVGPQGSPGIVILPLDGEDGQDSYIPGQTGPAGANGINGTSTPIITDTNQTIATDTCWIVSESLEVSAGTITEIQGGARIEITGPLNSGIGDGLTLLARTILNQTASISFTSFINQAFDTYFINLTGIIPVTNATILQMRMSTDNGVTFDSAANYRYDQWGWRAAGGNSTGGTGASALNLTYSNATGVSNILSNGGFSGGIYLYNPILPNIPTYVSGQFVGWYTTSNTPVGNQVLGMYTPTVSVNAIQFFMSSGSFLQGQVTLYGVGK